MTTAENERGLVAAGIVIRTNPPAQTLVTKGGEVTIVVSAGAPPIDVPNIMGTSEGQATAALSQFDVSVTSQDLPAGDPNDGKVVAQSVAGGQQLPAGSKITLTIGKAAAPTTTAAATTTTVAARTSDNHRPTRHLTLSARLGISLGTLDRVSRRDGRVDHRRAARRLRGVENRHRPAAVADDPAAPTAAPRRDAQGERPLPVRCLPGWS